jgi:hypothetical protein
MMREMFFFSSQSFYFIFWGSEDTTTFYLAESRACSATLDGLFTSSRLLRTMTEHHIETRISRWLGFMFELLIEKKSLDGCSKEQSRQVHLFV